MNIIDAIINLIEYRQVSLLENVNGNNRANNVGEGLEEYVKDLFAGTFFDDEHKRLEKINQAFSYLGNKNNPPDALLREGDAIEVKKVENLSASVPLNSSYPKNKLYANSPMISRACRDAERWKDKDIMYVVGFVQGNSIKQMSVVYGLDYCANESCYLRIKNTIKESVESIPSIEFSESKELGHINKVDPLGITYMRVRGMWGIENPRKVFSYVYQSPAGANFSFMCIVNDEKWKTFTNTCILLERVRNIEHLEIRDVRIKDPNNPAKLRGAKLITFWF